MLGKNYNFGWKEFPLVKIPGMIAVRAQFCQIIPSEILIASFFPKFPGNHFMERLSTKNLIEKR